MNNPDETLREMLAREADEARRIADAEDRGYRTGTQRMLQLLRTLAAAYRDAGDRAEIVGLAMDGWNKANFLDDIVLRLEEKHG